MPPRQKTAEAPPEDTGTISTKQMRQLHALLRDHGVTGDTAVHEYLQTAMVELGETPVASRRELTTVQAARLLADLQEAEVAHTPTDARLAALRAPFPTQEVGKLPRSTCKACSDDNRGTCQRHPQKTKCAECGNYHSAGTMHIDYVGHADVTARLLAVDPLWTWEPMNAGPDGRPHVGASTMGGNLWINLTILGVTRPGVGDGKNAKEQIGDAIRNAAMRFGVALDLWAKGDREWAQAEKDGAEHDGPDTQPAREQTADQRQQQPPAAPYSGPSTAELLAMIDSHAERAGITREQITAKWRADHGNMTVEQLDGVTPEMIGALEHQIATYLLNNPPTTGV